MVSISLWFLFGVFSSSWLRLICIGIIHGLLTSCNFEWNEPNWEREREREKENKQLHRRQMFARMEIRDMRLYFFTACYLVTIEKWNRNNLQLCDKRWTDNRFEKIDSMKQKWLFNVINRIENILLYFWTMRKRKSTKDL